MENPPRNKSSAPLPRMRRAVTIDTLRKAPDISCLSYVGIKTVAATRFLAMSNRAGRDGLLELLQRFSCIATAKAFLSFADAVGASWPDNVMVMQPCCKCLSTDEFTLAKMAEAAIAGNREGFSAVLDGFVRKDRHDRLYALATDFVTVMQ